MSNTLRILSADLVSRAASGHVGLPLGMADVITVLSSDFLKFYSLSPEWEDRDRFVLSAGHGCAVLYSLLYLTGYEKMTLDQIKNFRQLGSATCGHPELNKTFGIESTTGPLGQGLTNAVGMAIAEKVLNARYGDIFNHKTYALTGDGCLMEGISHEAISLAGHLGLGKLICLYDQNDISIDGNTSLTCSTDVRKRFESENWNVFQCDAHNMDEVHKALSQATSKSEKPNLVICSSIIGKGLGEEQGIKNAHGVPSNKFFSTELRKNINWNHSPFEIPDEIKKSWLAVGKKGKKDYEEWQESLSNHPNKQDIKNLLNGHFDADVLRKEFQSIANSPMSTRKASQKVIEIMLKHVPQLIGGSADLTESNCTYISSMKMINKTDFTGQYIHYGVREHAMAAVMNGIALHGGFIPYGGTFLTFTDYMRPAIRLCAMMRQKVIYVCTHDSIGLGEDGPTHQPIEHLDALRTIPNLRVLRPADLIETAECWDLAMNWHGPSVLALTRQNLPSIRINSEINLCKKGGYELGSCEDYQITLIATGSELHIASEISKKLEKDSIKSRLVSLPCMEIFSEQEPMYIDETLGNKPRFIIEAGTGETFQKYIRKGQDMFFGIDSFGCSAPYTDLYNHFSLTPDKIYPIIMEKLKK